MRFNQTIRQILVIFSLGFDRIRISKATLSTFPFFEPPLQDQTYKNNSYISISTTSPSDEPV